jgi:hypothetical protein
MPGIMALLLLCGGTLVIVQFLVAISGRWYLKVGISSASIPAHT